MHVVSIPTVHVRWMLQRDLPEAVEIEQRSCKHPWDEQVFLHYLQNCKSIGMTAELEDQIVGFMFYELQKGKLHLMNLAVHPAWRRRGIGSRMVQRLITKLPQQQRTRIVIKVRETHLAAQLFLQSHGFRAVSVLRHHFEDSAEDAYVMQFRLSDQRVRTSRICAAKKERREEDGDTFRLVPVS